MTNNPIIYKFFKDFTNQRKETNRVIVFRCIPFPNSLNYRDHQILRVHKVYQFHQIRLASPYDEC